ncbi:hypothetical protein BJ508DRAFT_372074 [Ascobolus immersus RN42]|uniref:Uncharacterized protein n=1 Tax=Ascobolus immersus RN42 TaxID=1160509 RepID=A0A3N4IUF5_ASCIM|nr:hypothetical protein BJ508DRAFT_372074 [Ascobolus immersus RN42]
MNAQRFIYPDESGAPVVRVGDLKKKAVEELQKKLKENPLFEDVRIGDDAIIDVHPQDGPPAGKLNDSNVLPGGSEVTVVVWPSENEAEPHLRNPVVARFSRLSNELQATKETMVNYRTDMRIALGEISNESLSVAPIPSRTAQSPSTTSKPTKNRNRRSDTLPHRFPEKRQSSATSTTTLTSAVLPESGVDACSNTPPTVNMEDLGRRLELMQLESLQQKKTLARILEQQAADREEREQEKRERERERTEREAAKEAGEREREQHQQEKDELARKQHELESTVVRISAEVIRLTKKNHKLHLRALIDESRDVLSRRIGYGGFWTLLKDYGFSQQHARDRMFEELSRIEEEYDGLLAPFSVREIMSCMFDSDTRRNGNSVAHGYDQEEVEEAIGAEPIGSERRQKLEVIQKLVALCGA